MVLLMSIEESWPNRNAPINFSYAETICSASKKRARARSELQDATQALSLVQELECLIDLLKLHGVGDVVIELQLARHAEVYKDGHLGPRLPAAKRGAFPCPPGHQLEGPC